MDDIHVHDMLVSGFATSPWAIIICPLFFQYLSTVGQIFFIPPLSFTLRLIHPLTTTKNYKYDTHRPTYFKIFNLNLIEYIFNQIYNYFGYVPTTR